MSSFTRSPLPQDMGCGNSKGVSAQDGIMTFPVIHRHLRIQKTSFESVNSRRKTCPLPLPPPLKWTTKVALAYQRNFSMLFFFFFFGGGGGGQVIPRLLIDPKLVYGMSSFVEMSYFHRKWFYSHALYAHSYL